MIKINHNISSSHPAEQRNIEILYIPLHFGPAGVDLPETFQLLLCILSTQSIKIPSGKNCIKCM